MRCAAFKLFKERGIENVTIHDVSLEAGISEASIYRYFGTKANLLFETNRLVGEVITHEFQNATIMQIEYQHATGFHQMELLIDAFERIYLQNIDCLEFALGCKLYWIRTNYIVNQKEYNKLLDNVIVLFRDALNKGKIDSTIHLYSDIADCHVTIWTILRGYMEQMAILDNFCPGGNKYRYHFETVKAIILKAIR